MNGIEKDLFVWHEFLKFYSSVEVHINISLIVESNLSYIQWEVKQNGLGRLDNRLVRSNHLRGTFQLRVLLNRGRVL